MTPTINNTENNPSFGTDTPSTSTTSGANIKQRVSEYTSHVKNTAADFGRSAASNIDRNMTAAAGALEKASNTLRHKVGEGEGKMPEIARTAADKLDTTARYLREHDSREIVGSLETTVRRNPGYSIMAALGLGLVIGMSMKKDRKYRY